MESPLTIVMYHYVRNLADSKYPDIKGLDIHLFEEQIKFIKKHYNAVRMEDAIECLETGTPLPPKSVLLTFDDAYSDHYEYVLPVLLENNLEGSFYIPAKVISDKVVLDVNRIHYILASVPDKNVLVKELLNELDDMRASHGLESNEYYMDEYAHASRFDTREVIFIKRMLQKALALEIREEITGKLFAKYVTNDESAFHEELYMSKDQIMNLKNNGMHIGNHGYNHFWLASLSIEEQRSEIEQSIDFLKSIGCDTDAWTMCYPYGNYNDDTLKILAETNCKLALTTEVGIANLASEDRFTLARLDTNDLPKDSSSAANDWYAKA